MPETCLSAGSLRISAAAALIAFAAGAAPAQPSGEFVPVTDAMLQAPAPGDWLMWRRTLDGWGFRRLCAISH